MWDLPHLVEIKRARTALGQGRLDEAFQIATDAGHREYRQCQELLEELVAAFLARGREHLQAGRVEDALRDAERAREAGGNQAAVALLRDEALLELETNRRARRQMDELVASVRGHLERGRLQAGAARLEESPVRTPETEELARQLKRRRLEAEQACLQVGRLLEAGEIDGALETARALASIAREEPQTETVLARAAKACEEFLEQTLREGGLAKAAAILDKVEALQAPGFDRMRWREALEECRKAAAAVSSAEWSRARVSLGRLAALVPGAEWVAACRDHTRALEEAQQGLWSSPLGRFASARRRTPHDGGERRARSPGLEARETMPIPAAPASAVESRAGCDGTPAPNGRTPAAFFRAAPARHFLLWVDGVGSFLLVRGDRTTFGRAGSSACPDIPLQADLEGIHAEVLRVDHDYFLIARGETRVGKDRIERRLLADGDEITLGKRTRIKFHLPTSLSSTAVLELEDGHRLEGDVRKVLLEDGHVVFGSTSACHVRAPSVRGRIVLSRDGDGFRCRRADGVRIEGREAGADAFVPLGAHVEAGELTFTITLRSPKKEPA